MMILHIEPCLKVSKSTMHQLFRKCREEAKEVEDAVIEFENGLAECVTLGARKTLYHHIGEEILDAITAYSTLAAKLGLNLEAMCEEVIKKNRERGYFHGEGEDCKGNQESSIEKRE